MRKLIITAIAAASLFTASSAAFAGYWTYGPLGPVYVPTCMFGPFGPVCG